MKKIVVAITGASGAIYAKVLLDKLNTLQKQWTDIGVIMTENAKQVWNTELDNDSYKNYSFKFYSVQDFNAPFASGSGKYDTMIIIPCSMGTLGRIASGISNDLTTRAADVILKEKRKLKEYPWIYFSLVLILLLIMAAWFVIHRLRVVH